VLPVQVIFSLWLRVWLTEIGPILVLLLYQLGVI